MLTIGAKLISMENAFLRQVNGQKQGDFRTDIQVHEEYVYFDKLNKLYINFLFHSRKCQKDAETLELRDTKI